MEVEFTAEDNYGQKHPIESEELIQAKLMELETELGKLPDEEKKLWKEAKSKCPRLTDDDHKLMFLRCEVFNTNLAAKRMGKYWKKRVSLLGPEKAYLPLRLSNFDDEDIETMKLGFARLLPLQDPVGRAIMFIDPARQDKKIYKTYDSFVRYVWYMMHSALESKTAQQKGFVMLIYPQNAKLSQFDRNLEANLMESLEGILPLRVASMQICHPPSIVKIILPIIKLLMGERLRKRIKIHTGKSVSEKLAKYGLDVDKLPIELGGKYQVDHDAWLEARKNAGK